MTGTTGYRVTWAWSCYRDFDTLEEAQTHRAEMVAANDTDRMTWLGATWPPHILNMGDEYRRVDVEEPS
jgi:hypothetical protein